MIKKKNSSEPGNGRRRTWTLFGGLVGAVALVLSWFAKDEAPVKVDSEVLSAFRGYYPNLLSSSPDGGKVLWMKRRGVVDEFHGLTTKDVKTGEVVDSLSIDQIPLRVTWSPDGSLIAYFTEADHNENRQLFIWDVNNRTVREIDIPASYAQPIVRWSPDSSRLAFTSRPGMLVVVNPTAGVEYRWNAPVGTFDWSSDSRHVALAASRMGPSHTIFIVDVNHRSTVASWTVQMDGIIQEIAWTNVDGVGVLWYEVNRASDTGHYKITEMDPETGELSTVLTRKENTRDIKWIPNRGGIVWFQQEKAGVQRMFVADRAGQDVRAINNSGAPQFRGMDSHGRWIEVLDYRPSVHQLVRVRRDNWETEIVAEKPGSTAEQVKHEVVEIMSQDGQKVPILVSRGDNRGATEAAVIRMHGGAALSFANERWAELQLYLDYNVTFLSVENRGAFGVDDLLAACQYVRDSLHVPRERVVLLGGSTAAEIICDAAARDPSCAGTLALIGVKGLEQLSVETTRCTGDFRVFAFHGRHDRESRPDSARKRLEALFGEESMVVPNGIFWVFDNERHWLLRDESNALVHTMVLRSLLLID